MTKGRVVVGKIESWLQKFESCASNSAVENAGIAARTLPHARKASGYDF